MPSKALKVTGPGLKPDVRYKSLSVAKFINCLMWEGKRSVAEQIFYQALEELKKKTADKDPLEVFETAINNVKPGVEVRSRRVGGATYQVPVEVNKKRQMSLATRWIIQAARAKKGQPMFRKLASELFDAYNNQGAAVTLRENTRRMAEANRAFAHYAW